MRKSPPQLSAEALEPRQFFAATPPAITIDIPQPPGGWANGVYTYPTPATPNVRPKPASQPPASPTPDPTPDPTPTRPIPKPPTPKPPTPVPDPQPPTPTPPPPSTPPPPAADKTVLGSYRGTQTQRAGALASPLSGAMSIDIREESPGNYYAVLRITGKRGTIEERTPLRFHKRKFTFFFLTPRLAIKMDGHVTPDNRSLQGEFQYWTQKSTYKATFALTKST